MFRCAPYFAQLQRPLDPSPAFEPRPKTLRVTRPTRFRLAAHALRIAATFQTAAQGRRIAEEYLRVAANRL